MVSSLVDFGCCDDVDDSGKMAGGTVADTEVHIAAFGGVAAAAASLVLEHLGRVQARQVHHSNQSRSNRGLIRCLESWSL